MMYSFWSTQSSSFVETVGTAMSSVSPLQAVEQSSRTISPSLPSGLNNGTTGEIAVLHVVSSLTTYTITASNAGSATATVI